MAAAKKSSLNIKLLIVVIVIILLIGALAVFMMGKKSPGASLMGGNNAFTSIRDALSKSVSLECEYKDPENRVTKAYIKNGAIRVDMTDPDPSNSGSTIIKDKVMHMWSGNKGYTYVIPEVTGEAGKTESTQNEDLMKDLEEYKDSCKVAVVSDSLFTTPSDVEFTDMSKMMETTTNPSEMTEEDIKNLMDQYGSEE